MKMTKRKAATEAAAKQVHDKYIKKLARSKDTSQVKIVFEHMITYGSITAMDAINKYCIMRLSALIFQMRRVGIPITTEWEKTVSGRRYGRYYIAGDKRNER